MLHRISDLAEQYKTYCITPHKCKLPLAKYSNCKREFSHTTNVIPITGACNMLTVRTWGTPGTGEAHVG